MKLLCVYLFLGRSLDDVLHIWNAKSASMDADSAVDVQLMCGPGLEHTKSYLRGRGTPVASAALNWIEECQEAGDFDDFVFEDYKAFYSEYYAEDIGDACSE